MGVQQCQHIYHIAGNFFWCRSSRFCGQFGCSENKNHENFNMAPCIWWSSSANAKFRTAKFSSEGLGGNSMNVAPAKISHYTAIFTGAIVQGRGYYQTLQTFLPVSWWRYEEQYHGEWLSVMEWCLRNFHWSSVSLKLKIIGLEVAGPLLFCYSHQSAVPVYTSHYEWCCMVEFPIAYLASVGSVHCVLQFVAQSIGSHTDNT